MNASGQASGSSTLSKGSAFRKPSYKRSVAILSTSGLVFGLGLSGSIQAFANPTADCVGNTVTPATTGTQQEKEEANYLNISNEIREANGIVCLNGIFVVDGQVYFNRHAKVYGIGASSVTSPYGTVFQSDRDSNSEIAFDIEINNLSILDSPGTAVYARNVEISNGSTLSGNIASGHGGAIYAEGNVTVSDSTLSGNSAGDDGGAIFALGSVEISNSTLSDNSGSSGGAIYSDGNVTVSNNSTISENIASASGGAIRANSVTLSASTLSGNTAGVDGGAIDGWATSTISNSTLSRNEASERGGAISSWADLTISNSTLSRNTAGAKGGAISSWADLTISNSTLSDNSTVDLGGAIYGYAMVLSANGSTFLNNSALHGGALYSEYDAGGGTVEISNSTFVDNDAVGSGSEGGAIYAYDGEVFFSTFVNNTASTPPDEPGDTPGNSIYKTGEGQFELGGNIFAGSSGYPQLGFGLPAPAAFTDLGGNVFSTSSSDETDIAEDPSQSPELQEKDETSVFGKSLLSIFGTATPTLKTYAPNTTQALGLVAGSPALNAVPNRAPFNTFTLDQRGATRSFPASAGAFEGVAPVAPTPTPTTAPVALAKTGSENPVWVTIAAGSMILVGGLVAAVASRLRRRTK